LIYWFLGANKNIAGKQKQLDSVYAAFVRQENQILGQQHHIINQQNQLTAQAAYINAHAAQINTLKRLYGEKLDSIRKCTNKLYRSAVQRSQKYATDTSTVTRRFANELGRLLNDQVEDLQVTESEEEEEEEDDVEEEDGNEEKEIEVIDLLDDDDGGEVAAVEGPGHVHQSAVAEHPDTVQQPPVAGQNVTAVRAVASEESPNKRVKLTERT
jgi:hypothetical protein